MFRQAGPDAWKVKVALICFGILIFVCFKVGLLGFSLTLFSYPFVNRFGGELTIKVSVYILKNKSSRFINSTSGACSSGVASNRT